MAELSSSPFCVSVMKITERGRKGNFSTFTTKELKEILW
jgi:hypothetical protein